MKLNKVLIAVCAVLLTGSAQAADSGVSKKFGIQLGGGYSLGLSNANGLGLIYGAKISYRLMDKLELGAEYNLATAARAPASRLRPSPPRCPQG